MDEPHRIHRQPAILTLAGVPGIVPPAESYISIACKGLLMKASARIEHCQKFGFRLASKSPRSAAGTSKFRTGRGDSYMFRDNVLRKLGYRQYADYLKSDVWQKIRARVLKARPTCECCVARQATQVHHLRYDFDTMLGSHTRHLAALCRVCHEEAEFDGDRIKNSLKRANSKLKRNRRKTRKRGPRSL